ncbi:hypothetical protein PZ895_14000 [Mesorhizobium sp. YIM 152430]|uniref:hypothetical protein n=1 Tax=Mesorhizobium sp. YIM 152430 TaxID=3031761 RepID=UPI0023DAE94A|nr:hypothetical protein [Mesorhizobium sp. YIM 152430]MDF1600877.1 hypothetical protein [Mesorhizobium sp. YIM 152430]
MKLLVAIFAATAISTAASAADDELYYGSRAGMTVTVVSKEGIGTSRAVVHVEHRPANAKQFCTQYLNDNSMACVRRTMAEVQVGDRLWGNCDEGTWTSLGGGRFVLLGAEEDPNSMADYRVRNIETGELLDGSSASGYHVALSSFQVLCPGVAD